MKHDESNPIEFLVSRFKVTPQLAGLYQSAARFTALEHFRQDVVLHEITGPLDCECQLQVIEDGLVAVIQSAPHSARQFPPVFYEITFSPSGDIDLLQKRQWPNSLVA